MKKIKNDFEYEQVLDEIESLSDSDIPSDIKRMKILRDLVEEYEEDLYFSSEE